jgi:hypothetical protein
MWSFSMETETITQAIVGSAHVEALAVRGIRRREAPLGRVKLLV